MPEPDPNPAPALAPTAGEQLARTRLAVVNVLVADGLGIALTGLALRGLDGGALDVDPARMQQLAYLLLFGLVVASALVRGRRGFHGDRAERAEQFHRARLASAVLAALAVPLGLVYGWAVAPTLGEVAPFWIAALALGARAIPREADVADLGLAPDSDPDPEARA